MSEENKSDVKEPLPKTGEYIETGIEKPDGSEQPREPKLGPRPKEAEETVDWESDEGREQRRALCAKAVRDALNKYECLLTVPTIDISSGRFIPLPQIDVAPPKVPAPKIITPEPGLRIPALRATKRS